MSATTTGPTTVGLPGARGRDLTVVLGEDQDEFRSQLRGALEREGFTVVAEAPSASTAIKAALHHRPSLCLLDVDLPGNGINASREIYATVPRTRIAILAERARDDEALRAVHAGADGYLVRDTSPERLAVSLRAVANGEPALPRSLTAPLVQTLRRLSRDAERDSNPISRAALYMPRLLRHYRRRRRSSLSRMAAWKSARVRMQRYR